MGGERGAGEGGRCWELPRVSIIHLPGLSPEALTLKSTIFKSSLGDSKAPLLDLDSNFTKLDPL